MKATARARCSGILIGSLNREYQCTRFATAASGGRFCHGCDPGRPRAPRRCVVTTSAINEQVGAGRTARLQFTGKYRFRVHEHVATCDGRCKAPCCPASGAGAEHVHEFTA